jgi:hypothetical protein
LSRFEPLNLSSNQAHIKITVKARAFSYKVLEILEERFKVLEVSRFKPNREGDGCHVFVDLEEQ